MRNRILERIIEGEKINDDKELLETLSLIINDEISLLESITELYDLNSGRGAIMVLKRDMEVMDKAILKYLYDDK